MHGLAHHGIGQALQEQAQGAIHCIPGMSYRKPRQLVASLRVNRQDWINWKRMAAAQGMKRNGWIIQACNQAVKPKNRKAESK